MSRPTTAQPAAAGAWLTRASHWLALASLAAAGPLTVIAPKGMWIAGVLLGIARLLQLAGNRSPRLLLTDLLRLNLLWLLAAFGTASALWAIDPQHSFERGLRLLLEFGVGGLMIGFAIATDRDRAGAYLRAAAAGMTAAAILAIVDIQTAGWLLFWAHHHPTAIFAYGPAAAFAAVIIIPLAIVLWQHGAQIWTVVLLAAVVGFVLIAANETAKLAVILAMLGGIAATWRWTRPLPMLAFAVVLLAVPLLVPQRMDSELGCWMFEQKASIVHRLGIWSFVDTAIAERPVLGFGLEASRQLPGGTMQLAMPDCGPDLGPAVFGPRIAERLPLHPHGFPMSIWLELGAVGAFLLLCTFLDWSRRLFRAPRRPAHALCAAAAGAFMPATVSFGMWQGWWLTTLFIMVALCLLGPATESGAGGRRGSEPAS